MALETGTATQDPTAAPPAEGAEPSVVETPAVAAEGSQAPVEAPAEEVDWRARHDALEKERIPALMSEAARATNEAKGFKSRAESIAQEFEGWIQFGAERNLSAADLLDKIRGSRAQGEQLQRDTQARQSETVDAINGLYRQGETAFAKFLDGLREAEPALKITTASLPAFRKTFEAIAPKSESAATAAAITAPVAKTPPKVPTPAASPTTPEPAWKGPKTKGKDLLRGWVGRSDSK